MFRLQTIIRLQMLVSMLTFILIGAKAGRVERITVTQACAICDTLPESVPSSQVYELVGVVSGINHANHQLKGMLNIELMDSKSNIFSYHQADFDSVQYTPETVPHYGDTVVILTRLEKYDGAMCAYRGYTIEKHAFVDPIIKAKEAQFEWKLSHQRLLMFLASVIIILMILLVVSIVYHYHIVYRSYRDYLTHVYNRRGGIKALYHYFHHNVNGYCCLMDIDHFKHVNDTYGHRTGDELLRKVAEVMIKHFQAKNIMRLGGDEFAFLVRSERDDEHLRQTVEAFVSEVESLHIDADPDYVAHVSIGATYYDGTNGNLEKLYSMTDKLLYQCKATEGCSLCF